MFYLRVGKIRADKNQVEIKMLPAGLIRDLGLCTADSVVDVFAEWLTRVSGGGRVDVQLVDLVGNGVFGPLTVDVKTPVEDSEMEFLLSGDQKLLGSVTVNLDESGRLEPGRADLLSPIVELLASMLSVVASSVAMLAVDTKDELTGVLNRKSILTLLAERTASVDGDEGVGILYMDLDDFKLVNDTYGHSAGDTVLREISCRFARQLRTGDQLGRLGGDEFLVVLEPHTDEAAMLAIAKRLNEVAIEPIEVGTAAVNVGCSIGASYTKAIDQPPSALTDLLVESDLAMYEAKSLGRPVVLADSEIARKADLMSVVDRELGDAIADDLLHFEYQPVRSLETLEVLGMEGYVRWDHSEFGAVPAPMIIERVHELGLAPAFTAWALDSVARDLVELRLLAPAFFDKTLSLNLTAHQLAWSGYLDTHQSMLERYQLRAVDIAVEVSEAGVREVGTNAEEALAVLQERGTIVALNNFGSNSDLLGYLTQFPVTVVKFDQLLIKAVTESARVQSVVQGLSQVANELGIYTLAEGIESQLHVDVCRHLDIMKGQGHFLGRPQTVPEAAKMLNREFATVPGRSAVAADS